MSLNLCEKEVKRKLQSGLNFRTSDYLTHITHTHSCLQDWWHSAIRPRLHFWLIVLPQSFVLCSSIHPSSAMQVATSFSYSSTAARLIMARMFSFALPRDISIFSFISLFFNLPFSAVCRAHRIAYALLDFPPFCRTLLTNFIFLSTSP